MIKRNVFTAAGRTKVEQDLFEYLGRLTSLRRELAPLRNGRLLNLHVSEQQYAYARSTRSETVVVVINNDTKPATVEVDLAGTGLRNGQMMEDRLGVALSATVVNGKMKVSLGNRSAAILVQKALQN